VSESYYTRIAENVFRPAIHVQGAWREDEQHLAPVCGLLIHEMETHDPRPELQLGKVTFDALGVIGLDDSTVEVRTLRPGRTIEQIEATLSVGDRPAVRATGWRLAITDTAMVAGGERDPLPDPEGLPEWDGSSVWTGGFIASLDMRTVQQQMPGRGKVWVRPRYPLVEGEAAADIAAYLGAVDTANGIATRVPPGEWMYPNVDLTVHLFRTPAAPWVGLDTRVTFGSTGLGLTSSTLHDVHGPVGRAEQSLTVRAVPPR